ncbi:hypothetical protein [Methanobrevibacter sp.]|uniref:hypothetical protein n=1 Tax=Methanobrevibacter sp. TaxID=66852 RepID=UPI003865797B
MIVDIATEERVPVNEIKDLPLGKLGNLICDESIKGNTDYVEELVTQFLEIVRDDLKDEDIQIYRHSLLTDPSGCNSIPRLIIHTRLDNVGEAKKTLKNLREYFQIQGGLRLPLMGAFYKTDNGDHDWFDDEDNDLNLILDFMEYKCNQLYREAGRKRKRAEE